MVIKIFYAVKLNKKAPLKGAFNITLMFVFYKFKTALNVALGRMAFPTLSSSGR